MKSVLEDAANRGAGGSQSGDIFNFTPSQLQRAGIANKKKFSGQRPFSELADAGQQVLPSSLPNSGTADRLLLAGGLLGGAESSFRDGEAPTGTMASAGLLGALALLGTKGGQKALEDLLFERPELAEELGRQISRRTGLFGHAAGGAALQSD